jgi:hypothetical protein
VDHSDSVNVKVATVSTILERDNLVKRIYSDLTKEPSSTFTVIMDKVNTVKVYHNSGPQVRTLIRIYLVIVIPVLVDISPLYSIYGVVDFHLDETIRKLTETVEKLQKLQGRRILKENKNVATLEQLVDWLR